MTSRVKYPDGNVLLRNLDKDYPIVSHGEGLYLFDQEGKRYIDASGGAMVVSIGHGNVEVARKVAAQMERVGYVNGQHFTSPAMEEFARKLTERAPRGLNRVSLLSSGSEAIEAACKFARQLWVERNEPQRTKFIARTPGYHGNTLFALSASARPHYRKFFGPMLSDDVVMIQAPYEYRAPVRNYRRDGAAHYLQELEAAIDAVGGANVAAFIFEPIIGSSAGGSCPPDGYFEAAQAICRKHGILMIADEVLCGAGRTGKYFASEHYNLEPDIAVLGKGLNGGLCPLSAVLFRDEHVLEMKHGSGGFMHAQTYLQSPTLAATGLAVLDYMDQHKLVKNAAELGVYFHEHLRDRLLRLRNVGFVAGKGLLAGVEFVADKVTKTPFERSHRVAEGLTAFAFEQGLVLWPNVSQADGVNGDLVMLAPPLGITRDQVHEITEKLENVCRDFFS